MLRGRHCSSELSVNSCGSLPQQKYSEHIQRPEQDGYPRPPTFALLRPWWWYAILTVGICYSGCSVHAANLERSSL
ncbi:hypothetical protein BDV25DRAFT_161617 [Aspergillus avenaceus]|uniref:Uncharacterized protein n=1 Tax=Aspergillus avenaceus TaxID=36643 RepID=A0A5N6TKF9_ASPAV|nr:hypothetical protein BDV25DRAFT_161617 [Aspergillus avenaceus]